MKIGILGTGHVACVFAQGFLKHGHQIRLGSRNPKAPNEHVSKLIAGLSKEHAANFAVVTTEECAKFGDMVMLATNWPGVEPTLKVAKDGLKGKIVIDVTNPIKAQGGEYIAQMEALPNNTSGGVIIQTMLIPDSKVVKAWNTVGNALFIDPKMADGKQPTMFICGNDAQAKQEVGKLLQSVGWNFFDCGEINRSKFLEYMCEFWCNVSLTSGNWAWAIAMQDSAK